MNYHIIGKVSGEHALASDIVTDVRVYTGSSSTGADHHKELISALSCSLNDVKKLQKKRTNKEWYFGSSLILT